MHEEESTTDGQTSHLSYKQIGIIFGLWSVVIIGSSFFITLVTDSIAIELNLSTSFAGAIFLGVATSLPELTAVITLMRLKNYDAALGNIIGSNIFNILAILGLTSIIKSIDINPMILKFDIFWMLGISLLLFIFILPLRKAMVTRWKGLVFVGVYVLYIYMVFTQKGV